MAKLKRGGLGRGLDALYEDNSAAFPDEKAEDGIKMVRVSAIEPNRGQPRKEFDSESLSELADSIREHGVLQPLLVRRLPGASLDEESYQLVAGERRWRAARMAGLSEVPVVVREMSEAEVLEFALIENLQREDLNPLEEAGGYQELIDTFGLTQEEVARKVGRSRSAVANALRVLKLPQELHPYLRDGDLTAGHAKALLTVKERGKMLKLAEITIEQGLSVREVERRAAPSTKHPRKPIWSPSSTTTSIKRCSWLCRTSWAAGCGSTPSTATMAAPSRSTTSPKRTCRRLPRCWARSPARKSRTRKATRNNPLPYPIYRNKPKGTNPHA